MLFVVLWFADYTHEIPCAFIACRMKFHTSSLNGFWNVAGQLFWSEYSLFTPC